MKQNDKHKIRRLVLICRKCEAKDSFDEQGRCTTCDYILEGAPEGDLDD